MTYICCSSEREAFARRQQSYSAKVAQVGMVCEVTQ